MNKITLENIEIEIVKKNIKNLNLSVNPPYGDVRLSVPNKMNDEAVKCFAISKLDWIKKQREKFKVQEKCNIEYKSGELHCLFGKKYELKVVENNGRQFAELNGEHIVLYVRKDSSLEKKEKIIQEFYRAKTEKCCAWIHWKMGKYNRSQHRKLGSKDHENKVGNMQYKKQKNLDKSWVGQEKQRLSWIYYCSWTDTFAWALPQQNILQLHGRIPASLEKLKDGA